jgi:hypothetical protein
MTKNFTKVCKKIWSFCMNDSEQNEAKGLLYPKRPYLQSQSYPPPILNKHVQTF